MIPGLADPAILSSKDEEWRPFVVTVFATLIATLLGFYGFTLALDPFGIRVVAGGRPAPLMDVNQRFMYPQVVRSGRYDGAIFGTSTMRLVDPAKLGPAFGTRLANLSMNAATPWEQIQLAELMLREVATPKLMVFGLDHTWCAADAADPDKRTTFRAFPPWLYNDNRLAMVPHVFNLTSLEIAGRVLMNRLGLAKPRMRPDGYGVFTPPDIRYDLRQAQAHIWEGGPPRRIEPVAPTTVLSQVEKAGLRLPAIEWLREIVARIPADTRLLLVFPPIHVVVQPRPGSPAAAADGACKERAIDLALSHPKAIAVDFRRPSAITTEDANYWDNLHYRERVAERVVQDIVEAARTGKSAADGTYAVVANRPGL